MKEVIVPADDLVCIGKEKLQEVIRCKDCKYLWHEVAEDLTPYGFYNERHIFLCQKHFDKEMGELREVMIDDFCSWAERKEE